MAKTRTKTPKRRTGAPKHTAPTVFLRGAHIYARPSCLADVPYLQRWINDPQTRNTLLFNWPMTELAERRWVEAAADDKSAVALIIVRTQGDLPLGAMSLREINWVSRTAVFGIMIGEAAYRGRGYGTEATRILTAYAFNVLGLHRIELGVLDFNTAGIRAYEKVGYRREGVARDRQFVDGRYCNSFQYAILAHEFVTP